MKGCFLKLDASIDVSMAKVDIGLLKQNGDFTRWQKYGLAYKKEHDFQPATNSSFHLSDDDKQLIRRQLPQSLLDIEVPDVWLLHSAPPEHGEKVVLPPHVDGVRNASINIYYDVDESRTVFYDYVAGGRVKEVASFVAQTGDVYLMNSNKPHAVEFAGNKNRCSISISFINTPYEIIEQFFLQGHA